MFIFFTSDCVTFKDVCASQSMDGKRSIAHWFSSDWLENTTFSTLLSAIFTPFCVMVTFSVSLELFVFVTSPFSDRDDDVSLCDDDVVVGAVVGAAAAAAAAVVFGSTILFPLEMPKFCSLGKCSSRTGFVLLLSTGMLWGTSSSEPAESCLRRAWNKFKNHKTTTKMRREKENKQREKFV